MYIDNLENTIAEIGKEIEGHFFKGLDSPEEALLNIKEIYTEHLECKKKDLSKININYYDARDEKREV